jgi:hypothetical protein
MASLRSFFSSGAGNASGDPNSKGDESNGRTTPTPGHREDSTEATPHPAEPNQDLKINIPQGGSGGDSSPGAANADQPSKENLPSKKGKNRK